MKTPHQQHQVAALFTLQFYPSATANRSLLHFHQQILQSLYKKLASDPMACYNTGLSYLHLFNHVFLYIPTRITEHLRVS